jgi:predicted esterase YcpF (UPF0227 family)
MGNRKALFIHGLHSDSGSTTGKNVSEILAGYGYETIIPTFDLLNCSETKERLEKLIHDEYIGLVVAHSLGGFYGYITLCGPTKILINPCLKPEIEIPKLMFEGEVFPEALKKEWEDLRNWKINLTDWEDRATIYSIFAKDDDLFSYADYMREQRFEYIYMIEGGHKPPKEALAPVIDKALHTKVVDIPAMAIPGVTV